MANSQPQPPIRNILGIEGMSKERLNQFPEDSEIWRSLKQAIAASSGFQRWQLERSIDSTLSALNLDTLVRSYLRETLETLAY